MIVKQRLPHSTIWILSKSKMTGTGMLMRTRMWMMVRTMMTKMTRLMRMMVGRMHV